MPSAVSSVGTIESKASNAIEALRKNLAPKCNVKRTGEWFDMASRNLSAAKESREVELHGLMMLRSHVHG